MHIFIFGVMIGAIVGGFSILLIAAIHVEEVEKQNDYLKEQLKEQLKEENIGTFTDKEISQIIRKWIE